MDAQHESVTFEQPLNERTRSLLRLEFLFAQFRHHRQDLTALGLRTTLHTLLDILTVMGRSDSRTELIKDLSEQRATLGRLRGHADIHPERLAETLEELSSTMTALRMMTTSHPATILRENEFLLSVLNRSSIPGGTCTFDLPAYHRWLSRPYEQSAADLQAWFAQLQPFERAIGLYLRLLRETGETDRQTARGGIFLHVPVALYSLVRVWVAADADLYPEISAGKHRISIRMMKLGDVNRRNVQTTDDVLFGLRCCVLNAGT